MTRSTLTLVVLGETLSTRDTVHVVYRVNADADGHAVVLTADDWGDSAVVVDVEPCTVHDECHVVTVAPDDTTTLEYAHVGSTDYVLTHRLTNDESR